MLPPRQINRILIIDTGCQGANWISKEVVDAIGALTEAIVNSPSFTDFNNNHVLARRQAQISFKRANGGNRTFTETFYVLPTDDHPFEIILGDRSIIKLGILQAAVLPLIGSKNNGEKKNEEHKKDKKMHHRKKEEKKEKKEQAKAKDNM
ncbi:hypothetical protein PVAG01_10865 [Phlyctema vagabunda]|uniref:Uncharacterized protein n=1 Tax=Phlyctema vagabunda TaxID=108571 RepID=A0ABR4P3H4_9HELO